MRGHRIVSLLPSATEIVCALGFEDQLVGRSHECDYPATVRTLPSLTEPKFKVEGSSVEIDQRVKQIVSEALSVYRVDTAKLRELRPDVIVTQAQCEVCAVSIRDVELAVADWIGAAPKLVALAPYSLGDVLNDIGRVAMALGAGVAGIEFVSGLMRRMNLIEAHVKTAKARPTIANIEWIEPLMAAGNWMPELTAIAGGENLFGVAGEHSSWMKIDELVEGDPEVIVIAPCGFDLARTVSELPALEARPEWRRLRAVQEGRVYLADGNQYFNRPGPRIVESLQILAEILHPETFPPSMEGSGWRRYRA